MGYRAHTVTQHRKYGSTLPMEFTQFEDYFDTLHDLYMDNVFHKEESQDYFELDKEVVEKEIERLTAEGLDKEFKIESSWPGWKLTNEEVVTSLKTVLGESPAEETYVAFEWY